METGVSLIKKAMEEKQKEAIFELYKSIFPNMTEETYISFEEYYLMCVQEEKTTEEIIKETEELLKLDWKEVD